MYTLLHPTYRPKYNHFTKTSGHRQLPAQFGSRTHVLGITQPGVQCLFSVGRYLWQAHDVLVKEFSILV